MPGPLAAALLKKLHNQELPEYSDLTPHRLDAHYKSDLAYVLSAACGLDDVSFRFAAIERLVHVLQADPNFSVDGYDSSPVDALFLNDENRPIISWLLANGATFDEVLDDPGENELALEYAEERETSRATKHLGSHPSFYRTPEQQRSGGDGARQRSPKKNEQAREAWSSGGAHSTGYSSRRLNF